MQVVFPEGMHLSEAERGLLLASGTLREYKRGAPVMYEAEAADWVALVVQGAARVCTEENGKQVWLGNLGPQDFFGESALLSGAVRCASVYAATRLTIMRWDTAILVPIVYNYPGVLLWIVRVLLVRLGKMDRLLFRYRTRDATRRLKDELRGMLAAGEGKVNVSELARRAGVSRPTASLIFKSLRFRSK